jgi:hypothetical protein
MVALVLLSLEAELAMTVVAERLGDDDNNDELIAGSTVTRVVPVVVTVGGGDGDVLGVILK